MPEVCKEESEWASLILPTSSHCFLGFNIYLGGGFKDFLFHPYLGKSSNLTNIFQMGWNHQLVVGFNIYFSVPKHTPKNKPTSGGMAGWFVQKSLKNDTDPNGVNNRLRLQCTCLEDRAERHRNTCLPVSSSSCLWNGCPAAWREFRGISICWMSDFLIKMFGLHGDLVTWVRFIEVWFRKNLGRYFQGYPDWKWLVMAIT